MKPRIVMSEWPLVQVYSDSLGLGPPVTARYFKFSGEEGAINGLRHILKHLHGIVRGELPPMYKGTA
jgi:hypothetical protein